jgi:RNA polymerase-binding transcription factor DksA
MAFSIDEQTEYDEDFFRELLEERRERLVEERSHSVSGGRGDLVNMMEPSVDFDDEYEAEDLDEDTENVTEIRLEQIDIALAKLDEGRFGECEVCGDGIDLARLLSWPSAPNCVGCDDDDIELDPLIH